MSIGKMISRISMFICLILLTSPVNAEKIDKIITFGDSLSDNGNDYKLSTEAGKIIPGLPVVPRLPPYYKGRFANGRVWIEMVAEQMKVPLVDYAYGGSWAESSQESGSILPYGLSMQVGFYLRESRQDKDRSHHLYTIWSGANDYLSGRSDVEYATTSTVNAIKEQMDILIKAGAKNFLVIGQLDLNLVPEVMRGEPELSEVVEQLVQKHNTKLQRMIEEQRQRYQDVNIIFQDTVEYIEEILEHPEQYHFSNVMDPCYDGPFFLANDDVLLNQVAKNAKADKFFDIQHNVTLKVAYATAQQAEKKHSVHCENPDEYFFWDSVHPTAKFHKAVKMVTLRKLAQNNIY